MKYGYARVSPSGKSESVDAQARRLAKGGCKEGFRDVHASGAKADGCSSVGKATSIADVP